MTRAVLTMALAAALVAAAWAASPTLLPYLDHLTPLAPLHCEGTRRISNQYIVKIAPYASVDDMLRALAEKEDIVVVRRFRMSAPEPALSPSFQGFAFRGSDEAVAFLRSVPGVEFVEQDSYLTTQATQTNPPSWGIDRIDQREQPLDKLYSYHDAAGNTSTIFVLDTGIEGDTDGNGHGTWVAGIAAGATYGVAKQAHVVAVKVFNDAGYGSTSDVIAGIDWVVQHHDGSVSIIILALGGSASPSLDAAVDAAVDAGVHVVTSAGSSGSDACNFSPGRNPKVVNAFGTDANDSMASGSNHGPCVTVGAPGVQITSTWIGDSLAEVRTLSGTSASAPHVAGVMALLAGTASTPLSPKEMKELVQLTATADVLKNVPENTPNLLVYNSPPDGKEAYGL